MSKINIVIPQYIQEMQLTINGKRKLYYEEDQVKELPKKYQNDNFVWKKGRLFDKVKKEFVVRNLASSQTPRFKAIAGNDIWARVHPRIRMAMVDAIKDNFRPYLPQKLHLRLPIQIEMDVYTPPRYCDWDTGNLWVYDKVFQDLLVEERLIPDDSIMYVTKSSGPRFIPVRTEAERKMVFTLFEESDPEVLQHVMYDLHTGKAPIRYRMTEAEFSRHNAMNGKRFVYFIEPTNQGETGSILTDEDNRRIYISVGKGTNYKLIRKGFTRAFSTLVQLNAEPAMSLKVLHSYEGLIEMEFGDRGLQAHIFEYEAGEGPEVQSSSQDESH